jgi:tRNA pseudouridine38-40 synthase
MAAGSTITDAVRTIYSFEVYRKGNYVFFKVSGNGFLYNMVRIMVGTVINSFEGKINLPIKEIILAKDRKIAGQTMPANGLFLNKVFYETNMFSNRREALFDF